MENLIRVARSEQIKDNTTFAVVVEGKKIVLVRNQGQLKAFKDSCPHQGAPLSHGHVNGNQLTCIYHGWKFNLEDGSFTTNQKLKLKSYPVHEENGQVFLQL